MQRIFVGGTRVVAAAVVLAAAACGRAPAPPPPPAVVVALSVHPDADARSGGTGTVRYPVEVTARYSNTMSFRVPGKLIKRNVRLGDGVKEGQILAQLDPVDAQKQFASAKAALDAAEHRLLYAQQQLDRDKAQSEANLIAANQLEQTQDSYTAALAGRDQASAQLVVARNNLQYNTLVADHDGLITSENADTGQVVAAGQAVYGLAWNGDTDVILDAAESDLGRIAVGQTAKINFPALPGRQFEARVREIAPAADAQSRTFRVKLQMTGPLEAVRLGMTGDAALLPIDTDVAADATRGANAAGAVNSVGATNASRAANSADVRGANTAVGKSARATTGSRAANSADVRGANTAAGKSARATTGSRAAANGAVNTVGPTSANSAADSTGPASANSAAATTHAGGAPSAAVAHTVSPQPTFTLPATAIFHQENSPAVWVITANDSTLQLRPVKVGSYTDHTSVVTAGLNDGDVVVLAGVHTVYAGQHVKPVRPLFDGEGNIDGPTPAAAGATGSGPTPAKPDSASTSAPAAHRPNIPQVAAAQQQAGAQ